MLILNAAGVFLGIEAILSVRAQPALFVGMEAAGIELIGH